MSTLTDPTFGEHDLDDEQERNNPDRVSGTVEITPPSYPLGDDVLPILGTYYVKDHEFGKHWCFWNIAIHKPYRGAGSLCKSYVYDLDDVTKQRGRTCLY